MFSEPNRLRPSHRLAPELLAPAGSPEALEAAFLAGADAVYLGGSRFNARLNAHNFDPGQLREAVTHAHRMGGRVYLTLNTLLWDRELTDALEAAYEAAACGVDALLPWFCLVNYVILNVAVAVLCLEHINHREGDIVIGGIIIVVHGVANH